MVCVNIQGPLAALLRKEGAEQDSEPASGLGPLMGVSKQAARDGQLVLPLPGHRVH